jgi:hypothetical protein
VRPDRVAAVGPASHANAAKPEWVPEEVAKRAAAYDVRAGLAALAGSMVMSSVARW